MLLGFTSRWTTPWRCASARLAPTRRIRVNVSPTPRRRLLSSSARLVPSDDRVHADLGDARAGGGLGPYGPRGAGDAHPRVMHVARFAGVLSAAHKWRSRVFRRRRPRTRATRRTLAENPSGPRHIARVTGHPAKRQADDTQQKRGSHEHRTQHGQAVRGYPRQCATPERVSQHSARS
jgi:hypothetical protein